MARSFAVKNKGLSQAGPESGSQSVSGFKTRLADGPANLLPAETDIDYDPDSDTAPDGESDSDRCAPRTRAAVYRRG